MKPHDRLAPLVDQARRNELAEKLARGEMFTPADNRDVRQALLVDDFPNAPTDRPITAERIERAMVLLAFIITSTGKTKFAPLLERLERDLAEYKAERDPMSRAARILRDYSLDGTGKAIR
jgi:hypothetical protein